MGMRCGLRSRSLDSTSEMSVCFCCWRQKAQGGVMRAGAVGRAEVQRDDDVPLWSAAMSSTKAERQMPALDGKC